MICLLFIIGAGGDEGNVRSRQLTLSPVSFLLHYDDRGRYCRADLMSKPFSRYFGRYLEQQLSILAIQRGYIYSLLALLEHEFFAD